MKTKSAIIGGVTATVGTMAVIADGIPKIVSGLTNTYATVAGTSAAPEPATGSAGANGSVLGKLDEALAKAAFAPSCDAFWIERNQLYNLHGRCFNSSLGQAVFDNSDCTPGPVTLPQSDIDYAMDMRRRETRSACEVDTTRRSVDVDTARGTITIGRDGYRFAGVDLVGPAVAERSAVAPTGSPEDAPAAERPEQAAN